MLCNFGQVTTLKWTFIPFPLSGIVIWINAVIFCVYSNDVLWNSVALMCTHITEMFSGFVPQNQSLRNRKINKINAILALAQSLF